MYALIQFMTVVLCYASNVNVTDRQYLYIDLVVLVPLSIF